MTLTEFSDWLSSTAFSQFIQTTTWLIPTFQTIHILCIAVLFSAALMLSLRILGTGLKTETLQAVAARFVPSIWVCLLVLLLTGSLLIIAEPGRTVSNPAFYIKLVAIVLASLVTIFLNGFARGSKAVGGLHRMLAIVSLLLWCVVIVAGRLIAYIESH